MTTKDIILSTLIILLLITTSIFGVRSKTYAQEAARADDMMKLVVEHLNSLDYPKIYPACRGISRQERLKACLDVAMKSEELAKRFREVDFRNAVTPEKEGYLIIKNEKGGKSYESAKFTLNHNNKAVARGCTTPGEIAPGYTCRLNFKEKCEPGDNLEILYNGERAYLKTC